MLVHVDGKYRELLLKKADLPGVFLNKSVRVLNAKDNESFAQINFCIEQSDTLQQENLRRVP
ncbi:MAG: hypothetical protein CVU55_06155 [Deltaproteobacteria bacterium HGW-Deltaproteobacteria-13]|jgi:hypothetical protein|nr:MAG: hypothetical protein CVU55_06155 [Deltaproteobacteria bacterium HGW-Deltaproteobacteria-13]